MQAALQRYHKARGSGAERLVSGSDDFTMFLWEPSTSKKPLHRMTGHVQLINQASLCCSFCMPIFIACLLECSSSVRLVTAALVHACPCADHQSGCSLLLVLHHRTCANQPRQVVAASLHALRV